MIYTTTSGSPLRRVVDGVNYTVGAQGQPAGQRANNNRQHMTPAFAALDALIRSLDATYDNLPDKSPWLSLIAYLGDNWSLCANCAPDLSAKKLFRQYNFARSLMGLPLVSAPLTLTPAMTVSLHFVFFDATVPGVLTGGGISVDAAVSDIWLCIQLGQVLTNPLIYVPAAAQNTPLPPTDPTLLQLWSLYQSLPGYNPSASTSIYVTNCLWDNAGCPGIRTTNSWFYTI